MSKVQSYLDALTHEQKMLFVEMFGDVKRFYAVVYFIIKNEHVVEMEKQEHYDERLKIIREIKRRVESLVSSYGLDGKELVADIASEYFEDYVNYKNVELSISNDEFVAVVKKISRM